MKLKHEKRLCILTSILFVIYFISGILLTSCGTNEPDKDILLGEAVPSDKDASTDETAVQKEGPVRTEKADTVQNLETSEDYAFFRGKLPEPAAEYGVDWGCGIYYSSISHEAVEEYLRRLAESGWYYAMNPNVLSSSGKPFVTEVPVGITQLPFTDGENLLQLLINIESDEGFLNNSILIRLEEGVTEDYVVGREKALTKSKAQQLIQSEVDSLVQEQKLSSSKAKIIGLLEIFIRDAYEKLGLQAYAAISDTGITGSFLVCSDQVLPIMGYLQKACVADLDGNGKYELLDLNGYGSGIYRIDLNAYEYSNPVYFSSLTELLHRKYYNCFVPKRGYGELKFKKISDSEVHLIGVEILYETDTQAGTEVTVGADTQAGTEVTVGADTQAEVVTDNRILSETRIETDYGRIVFEDYYPIPENLIDFPYSQWKDTYDQSRLPGIEKKIPEEAPEIIVSIDGRSLDYITTETKWDGIEQGYNTSELFRQITGEGSFIPTYIAGGITDSKHNIVINFGDSIPDTIKVKDAMMQESGGIRYGSKQVMDREVEILDDSRVQLALMQHMSYYLSSNSLDYEKNWYRLFHVVCTWGDKEAVYTFVINTGNKDRVTEIEEHDFLEVEGTNSLLSSSWGIGLLINRDADYLPDRYIIEWQVSAGEIRSWSGGGLKPVYIANQHNGYPMTTSEDLNQGAVIWTPDSYEEGDKATIRAYIYRSREDRSPVAVSEVNMICLDHIWLKSNN